MKIKIIPSKLSGSIEAIPSKSHAHRVLIAQKLAQLQGQQKANRLNIPSFSRDIEATKSCLLQLSEFSEKAAPAKSRAKAALAKSHTKTVPAKKTSAEKPSAEKTSAEKILAEASLPVFDCGESGSTLRFMLPTAMAVHERALFAGQGKLPQRPISPLKEEMEKHGCRFEMCRSSTAPKKESMGKTGRSSELSRPDEPNGLNVPNEPDGLNESNDPDKPNGQSTEICRVYGKLTSGNYSLPGNISSQFITGLLFALPILEGDSVLKITTILESAGYVDLSLKVLRDFGIIIEEEISSDGLITYKIPGKQKYREPENLRIEGDWSNAAFWLCCGALGGDIKCTGLDVSSSQRDKEILSILRSMGAEIEIGENTVSCRGSSLSGTKVSVAQFPDLVPAMASVMTLAKGDSLIADAHRLRIKESDRLLSVCDFLRRLNADIRQREDELVISGSGKLKGGEIDAHNDHRIVMAAAVASCGCGGPVIINGAEAVEKSYPEFFNDFNALGGKAYEI